MAVFLLAVSYSYFNKVFISVDLKHIFPFLSCHAVSNA